MKTTNDLQKNEALEAARALNSARDAYTEAHEAHDAASDAKEAAWEALLVANKVFKEGATK